MLASCAKHQLINGEMLSERSHSFGCSTSEVDLPSFLVASLRPTWLVLHVVSSGSVDGHFMTLVPTWDQVAFQTLPTAREKRTGPLPGGAHPAFCFCLFAWGPRRLPRFQMFGSRRKIRDYIQFPRFAGLFFSLRGGGQLPPQIRTVTKVWFPRREEPAVIVPKTSRFPTREKLKWSGAIVQTELGNRRC
ncbi:uncharacterized protein BP01DRAFT_361351 [Aspergillus saccharolyticus JOP 1030-1]|uniref:Uncharacterized protein n=1 Tax=Aspergillus saccharolyticus JOP 1030-1 TaxID=1450539 RepID=A0A318Z036_9EURO|nr:hypothetical protein BP01DRAFT_361351 [Aspergillus saccharolyticus JOP 1030-1]PYH40336.1 hypothetical protein BP01DRAFT_361351 [Aspergillus saccharolyticus JOP 1030-1]